MAFSLSNFSKPRYSPIAIDFGADSLKVLQIVPGDPPQLIAAGRAVLPAEARTDPGARTAFLAEALRDLLRQQPFKGRRAILSFPAFQTLMQHLEIGRAEGDEVETAVGMQLRNRLDVEPSRMVIRHFPVRQHLRDGATLQEVICLAASRDVVMGYLDIARRCKIDVIGMHTEPVAVLKAFEHLYRRPADQDRTTCFIDIGAAMTKVVIAHGTRMVFAKSIHAAGDQMTRQLAKSRSIDFMEAYRLRTEQGNGTMGDAATSFDDDAVGLHPALRADPSERAATAMLDSAQAVTAAPDSDALECIVDELQLCLRYHARLFPDKTVEKLVFLGGEARNLASCQTVARSVRVAAQLGDPFARVARIGQAKAAQGVDLDVPQPGWAVAMGLCLSEANL